MSKQQFRKIAGSLFFRLLPLGDPAVVALGYLLAFKLRYGNDIPAYNWEPFLAVLPWLCIGSAGLFAALGMYERKAFSLSQLIGTSALGVIGIAVLTTAVTFWLREFAFPRSVILIAVPVQITLICLWRIAARQLEITLAGRQSLLVVGTLHEARQLVQDLSAKAPASWLAPVRAVATEGLKGFARKLDGVDAVLVAPSLSREEKAAVVEVCLDAGKEVLMVPDMYDILLSRGQLTSLNDLPVIQVQKMGLAAIQAMLKRGFDLVVTAAGMLLLGPVFLLCALAVKFSSPGPVFYSQQRVGLKGKNFHLYKFRTMVDRAEEQTGPVLSVNKDPRITKAGQFLRTSRLDELPQLFNVLRGDMSLVGPRPERPFFAHRFADIIPDYNRRHLVRPGLTGLAQVYGNYSTAPEDKLRYDLYYIRNYSLFLDLKIIIRTLPVLFDVMSARGAAPENCNWLGKADTPGDK